MNGHYADNQQPQAIEAHYFEQLNLDMEWATEAAEVFVVRDGADAITSLSRGYRAIAGRRWHRFKEAEKLGEEKRATEMKAFASFWYKLASDVEKHHGQLDHSA